MIDTFIIEKMYKEVKIDLGFDPVEHKYFNKENNEPFISATTLIGKYKNEFNTHYWSMYTGLKDFNISVGHHEDEIYITVNGVKQHIDTLYSIPVYKKLASQTKSKWKAKTKVANDRGNKIHDYLEDNINLSRGDIKAKDNELITPLPSLLGKDLNEELSIIKTKNDLNKTNLYFTYPDIYERLLLYINQGCTIIAEKKIYTSTYGVAGMIDVLILKGKKFAIMDWKTNKDKMHFVSGYYKKQKVNGKWVKTDEFIETNDKLKYPLKDLAMCKGIIYSLQLSLYAYIMTLWGYELVPNGLEIFHIRPRRKPKLIKIKYYKNNIIKMLEHYKESKIINNNVKPKINFKLN